MLVDLARVLILPTGKGFDGFWSGGKHNIGELVDTTRCLCFAFALIAIRIAANLGERRRPVSGAPFSVMFVFWILQSKKRRPTSLNFGCHGKSTDICGRKPTHSKEPQRFSSEFPYQSEINLSIPKLLQCF